MSERLKDKFETVAVPFVPFGNRQCLTALQVAEEPWLAEFIAKFPACFAIDTQADVWVFYPDGDAPKRTGRTRDEHLAWCKERALEYVDRGDITNAWGSMASDLGKHPETKGHAAIKLGTMMLIAGHLSTAHEMRRFIEGFN